MSLKNQNEVFGWRVTVERGSFTWTESKSVAYDHHERGRVVVGWAVTGETFLERSVAVARGEGRVIVKGERAARLSAELTEGADLAAKGKAAAQEVEQSVDDLSTRLKVTQQALESLKGERDDLLAQVNALKSSPYQALADACAEKAISDGVENYSGNVWTVNKDNGPAFEVVVLVQRIGAESPQEQNTRLNRRLEEAVSLLDECVEDGDLFNSLAEKIQTFKEGK